MFRTLNDVPTVTKTTHMEVLKYIHYNLFSQIRIGILTPELSLVIVPVLNALTDTTLNREVPLCKLEVGWRRSTTV